MRQLFQRLCLIILFAMQCSAACAEEQWERDAALFRAARMGSAEAIRIALKDGADINARTPSGETALVLAIMTQHAQAAKALLDAGAGLINEVFKIDKFTGTPLGMAAWNDSGEMIAALLEYGADPKQNDHDALRGAVVTGSVQNVGTLLARADEVNHRFGDGQLPLTIAAMRGNAVLCEALLDSGAKIDARSNEGATALMFATALGHEATVALLLKRGAAPSLFDVDGRTALAMAAQVPDTVVGVRIEKLLVNAGAQKKPSPRAIDEAFLLAAHQGDLARVTDALDKGAELEVRGEPNIKLWLRDALSASVTYPKVCRLLLDRGINPHMRSAGFTALHAAADRGQVECIEALLAAGLNPNEKAKGQQTPLYMAINARRPAAIVAALLRGGANANGLVGAAKERGLVEVAKLLEGAGGRE